MKDPLERTTLADQLADLVAEKLRRGFWEDGLPGYRALADEFGVGWRTSRNALRILEERGLLEAPEAGKPRIVREKSLGNATPRHRVLLVITSTKITTDVEEQEVLDQLLLLWTAKGGSVSQTQVDFRRHKRPETTLQKLVQKHSAEALIIKEPNRAWADAARNSPVPVYFLGGDIPHSEFPNISGFAVIIRHMVADTIKHLKTLGHTRIMVPDEGRGEFYREAVLSVIRAGLEGTSGSVPADLCCPEFPEMEPEAWMRYWEDSIGKYKPTAIIIHKETSYLSLLGFCSKQGWKIPDHLSVVCLSASDNLRWCYPQPDHVTFPRTKAISHFNRWLKSGLATVGMKPLAVDHVVCGSVRHA